MRDPEEDLKLLSLFHWILAGIHAAYAFIPVIYVFLGGAFLALSASSPKDKMPPAAIGGLFILIGVLVAGFMLLYAAAVAFAGYLIKRRRSWTTIIVIDAILCLAMPFGTVLGVFSIVTLQKPNVRALFDTVPPAPATPLPSG